eukprot:TRINITY_DN6646_c0_g3_i3.p3 TRINITY_DN6646_c0_g3~~TRINITY_DN6646_c0_g3_i3.p3  ORF type:complete len:377 (+),score=33.87 TRINITY_DN6646_c0_g3_i3:1946-3076(+)
MKIISKRLFASVIAAPHKPYSVLFFGSEEYARATLSTLLERPNLSSLIKRIVAVVPPKSSANSPTESMHQLVNAKQIEYITFRKRLNTIMEYISVERAKNECPLDIGIIGSFGRKVPARMIEMFPLGMLVAHPSLLPKHRGPCPIQHSVIKGDKTTGTTIINISKEVIDGGKILWQGECKIDDSDNYLTLAQKCGSLAGEGLASVLENLEHYKKYAKEQNEAEATLAPMINKEDGLFRWDRLEAEQAVRFQRALYKSPSPPYSKLQLNKKLKHVFFERLFAVDKGSEFYKTTLEPVDGKTTPGDLYWNHENKSVKNRLCIKCADGWVYSGSVKVEGSGFIKAEHFVKNFLKNKAFAHKLITKPEEAQAQQSYQTEL